MNDCQASSTEPAQSHTQVSAPDPAVLTAYDRGWRHGALDVIELLPSEQRTALLTRLREQRGW